MKPINILNWIGSIGIHICLVVLLMSCSHGSDEPRRNGSIEHPGRPGIEDGDDDDRIIADGVWRYVGGGINLRYDDCGILFTLMSDGEISIVNIDGLERISAKVGGVNGQSSSSDVVLIVNGVNLHPVAVRMLKRDSTTSWYKFTMSDGDTAILVVPISA